MSTSLVDAHVHFHACYDLEIFLDGALRNLRTGAAELGDDSAWTGYLLLTEARDARWFRRWQDGRERARAWMFEPTTEKESLCAVRETGERLVVVAGRQIVSRAGLEVLALGRDLELPDDLPLEDILERVRESGALPVLPWGFGKWWGRRGTAVARVLREQQGRELFLGDNSGRLRHGAPPRLFREARELGIPVLPGSDPLPFPRHAGRAGSYGFALPGGMEESTADLLRRIRAAGQPRSFGRRAGLSRFLRDQVEMQLS